MTSVDAAQAVVDKLADKDVAAVVNNAGIVDLLPFNEETLQSIHNVIQINMIAPVLFSTLLYNKITRRGRGAVINIASTAAYTPSTLFCIYSMTKAFMLYFTMVMREESKNQIDIIAACPAFVRTQLVNFKRPSFDTISVQD